MQRRFGGVGNGLQQRQGHLVAYDCSGLEQPLVFGGQTVDTRCQHRLHRGRHLDSRQGLGQAIRSGLADQDPGLNQGADAFFQEERIPFGARN